MKNRERTEKSAIPDIPPSELSDAQQIQALANKCADGIRLRAKVAAQNLPPVWNDFLAQGVHDEGFTSFPEAEVRIFADALRDLTASNYLTNSLAEITELIKKIESFRADATIMNLLAHDLNHFRKSLIQNPLMTFYQRRKNRVVIIPSYWIENFQYTVDNFERFASIPALMIEYAGLIGGVIDKRVPIPKTNFNVLRLVDTIAHAIVNTFHTDDYELLTNPTNDVLQKTSTNSIIVSVDPQLELHASEPMIWSIIYNLVKNSAKAIEKLTSLEFPKYDPQTKNPTNRLALRLQENKMLEKKYQIRITVEVVGDNLMLTVSDTGEGLSYDNALKRMKEVMKQAEDQTDGDSDSFWMKRLLAMKHAADATSFVAWAEGDPTALRSITLGALSDTLFLEGYKPEGWGGFTSLTSNTGLPGVYYLIFLLGGSIMASNKFEGGAYFSMCIPLSAVSKM